MPDIAAKPHIEITIVVSGHPERLRATEHDASSTSSASFETQRQRGPAAVRLGAPHRGRPAPRPGSESCTSRDRERADTLPQSKGWRRREHHEVNLVHPGVSAHKVERELALWDANAEAYSRRGWIMLRREPPLLDIAFLAPLPIAGNIVPAVAACVQIDFTNFDLWAPSVEFIDPISREFATPVVQAIVEAEGGAQNLIVGGRPDTGRPFLCIPGVRQYHSHPQHTGDPWLLLHRPPRGGTLSLICERIWQTMARTLLGVQVQLVTLPGSVQLNVNSSAPPTVTYNTSLLERLARQTQSARATTGIDC